MPANLTAPEPQLTEQESNLARKALTLITVKFISLWLFFMVIIFAIGMLADIDWSRSYLEKMLADASHRQVKLGHLTWTFGLGGLAVDTTKISILEKDGQPFLKADTSEIGIAFWSLLSGEFRIRHLYFERPELWSYRYSPGVWNFDDLLKTAINVDYLECTQGTIHIEDVAKTKSAADFPPIDLTSFKLKLVRPNARSNHPVFFSCSVPRDGITSSIKLEGFVRGSGKSWQQDRTQINLQLTQFAPEDLKPIAAILNVDLSKALAQVEANKISGLFDCSIEGKGVVSNDFQGTITAKGTNIEATNADLGQIKAPLAMFKTSFKSEKNVLSWKNAQIKLPHSNLEFLSEGTATNWRAASGCKVAGSGLALCENLSTVSNVIVKPSTAYAQNVAFLSRLEGKALADITFSSDKTETIYKSKLRLSNLAVNNLKEILPEKYLPVTLLLGLSGSSSQARMQGNVSIDSKNAVDFEDCTITDGDTTYKVSGAVDLKSKKAHCNFVIKDLSLSKIGKSVNETPQIRSVLERSLSLTKQSQFAFTGNADCQGQFTQLQNSLTYKTDVILKGDNLSVSAPKLSLNNARGHFICENGKVSLKDFVSTVDNGKLEIGGILPAADSPTSQLQIQLHGTHFDLARLGNLLTLFNIDSAFFSHEQLRGLVKDITLNLDGAANKPSLRFIVLPEELYYQPIGLTRPLKAVSGTVTFNHEQLELKDVGLALNGCTVATNLNILNLLSNPKIDKFKLKSTGVDLKDVCFYFNSPLLPAPFKRPLQNLSRCLQIGFNGGKGYGNISGTIDNDKLELDGLLGLMNANLKFAGIRENLEHVNGAFIISDDKLLIQDASAVVHGSTFKLDGKISRFQDVNPQWNAELVANVDPPELSTLVPEICQQLKINQFKLSAASKIVLKAKAHGTDNSSSMAFFMSSDPQGRFNIVTPAISFHQPADQKLTMEGTLSLNPELVKLNDLRVTAGGAIVQARGWLKQTSSETATTGTDSGADREIDFMVRVPEYVPTATLLQLLSPSHTSTASSGNIKGFISATGLLSRPYVVTEIHCDKVSVPDYYLSNLTGELITDKTPSNKQKSKTKARLKLDTVTLGNALFTNLTANVEGSPPLENQAAPLIAISDCHATFAGGKLGLDGSVDLSAKKIRLRANLKHTEADEALSDLFGLKDEMTGTLSLDAVLGANFNNDRSSGEILTNVVGSGEIKIVNGNVTRFSHLQTRITQGKLLHQGLFGFNVNNLFQSVVPVRSGNFRQLSTSLNFNHNLISIENLEYDGDELHLTASGKANLALHTIELEIAGKVPRVSNSFIGGPMGEISKEFTVQRVIDSLTLHKLESLPSLPILGEVASAKPRQFTFKILAPYDQPKLVSHSIEKSFRWTEDRPLTTVVP